MKKWLILIGLLSWSWSVIAQDKPIFPLFIAPDLDTNYIDLQRDKWSIRAFSSLKFHALQVEDKVQNRKVRFRPNNLFSVGVGFAYRFWLIDIGFGINPIEEDRGTEAFDLQTSVLLGSRHLFSYGLQWYRGFDTRGPDGGTFRKDVRIVYTGLDYLYYFNYRKLSMRAVYRGDLRQKRSSFSFIAGAFMALDLVRADSSLIPMDELDLEGNPIQSEVWVSGIQAGVAGNLVIAKNLILFGSAVPGIGGEWGNIQARGRDFTPKWGPVGKLYFQGAIMYTHPRFYLGLTGNGNFFYPVITPDFKYRFEVGKLKLLFGWRFLSRVEFLEKANRILEKR